MGIETISWQSSVALTEQHFNVSQQVLVAVVIQAIQFLTA
jgi:hypothetical protein